MLQKLREKFTGWIAISILALIGLSFVFVGLNYSFIGSSYAAKVDGVDIGDLSASGGLVTEPGTAGNLPSGETYIVPYEGEIEGDATASRGQMPVQFADEVVIFLAERVVESRADAMLLLVKRPGIRHILDLAEHLDREP